MPNIAAVTNVKRKHIERERRMKHKHYEIIVAFAGNTELSVFCKGELGKKWVELSGVGMPCFVSESEYFLCLPQHKDACFHWLNGGDVQVDICGWSGVVAFDGHVWSPNVCFMSNVNAVRIKPKKEKRWIAVDASTTQCTRHYSTKESCFNSEFAGCEGNASGWQFIEIEVEV